VDDGTAFERVTKTFMLPMAAGDCLLFHTDGVREAVNAVGEEFGLERLDRVFLENAPLGAEAVLAAIRRELSSFAGDSSQMDDVTLLVLERR
jgi:sigma-B regulation protein RsbU (phosphoserine phosphatase)